MRQRDEIDALYHTTRWTKCRHVVLIRDAYLCQECLRRGLVTPANTVHHRVPARDNLALFFDQDNLEATCEACHNRDHPERSGGKPKQKQHRDVMKFYSNNETS
ncbi:HNH endonuclease [Sporolactobacillus shoreae]|uniref:Putative HNH nuclease YajD n=1 Tax=Sporolactobacillus shoreae TaxID=1465501 RepID=A0A4Z0GGF6_9BACL|nr:HNH endonuclease signature motif containing protein [Sporolactobacillus shoreae]TGA95623.1 HNH endonuclease [Sporolactobacillus shoreae]